MDGLPLSGFLSNGTDVDQYFFDFLPGYSSVEISFMIVGGSPVLYGSLGGNLPTPASSDFQMFASDGVYIVTNTDPMFTAKCGTAVTTVCRFNLLVRNSPPTVVRVRGCAGRG